MAFYNATHNLPRTPDAFMMNATLPSIRPSDLINSWSSSWRSTKQDPLLTPPMSSNFQSRTVSVPVHHTQPDVVDEEDNAAERMKLPPIRHLERLSNHLPPLTPPEDLPHTARLPSPQKLESDDFFQTKPMALEQEAPYLVDWLDFTRTRSAHFIAEKTCEMICYLWFSSNPTEPQGSSSSSTNGSPPFHTRGSTPSPLQLVASPPFVSFMQKLLETTQVSQSVIVLSLHFIYRLKERNRCTPAQRGSEFRIAVAGLMMANKFLDDNTYTNKTWSEVSGIDLEEINRMEREFLLGVDFNLYVDKATYESWLNLLKGLVMAKERDTRQFRKSSRVAKESRIPGPHHYPSSTGPASRTYSPSSGRHRPFVHRHRARSSSPTSRTMSSSRPATYISHTAPPPSAPAQVVTSQYTDSPVPRSGSKRTAQDAFSPTSASFTQLPSKRPVSISLQIPEYSHTGAMSAGGHSNSPLEGLQSFSNMSLGTNSGMHSPLKETTIADMNSTSSTRSAVPEMLVAAYAVDEGRRSTVPQNLYFYSLAGSPTGEASPSQESRVRKARLRYHQPTAPSTYSYADLNACASGALYAPQASDTQLTSTQQPRYLHSDPRAMGMTPMPTVVQSASTSPAMGLPFAPTTTLPHFRDDVWARPPIPAPAVPSSSDASFHPNAYAYSRTNQEPSSTQRDARMYSTDGRPLDYLSTHHHGTHPVPAPTPASPVQYPHPASDSGHHHHHQRVPSAPFANNGPPGVGAQFYPTPVQSSSYPHSHAHNPRHVNVNVNGAYPWVRTRY